MKNTKHTEMNDTSSDQEITSQSKRKILASIGVTSGVLGASTLSHNWVKPVVNSVVLPAHAQTTPPGGTDAPGTDAPGTDAPGTDAPGTDAPTGPMIMVVSESADSRVNDGGEIEYYVSLSDIPSETVTVTVSSVSTDAGLAFAPVSLTFTRADYADQKTVTVTAPTDTPADPVVTVDFTAAGGDYAEVAASASFTVFEEDNLGVTDITAAKVSNAFTDRNTAVVTWTLPATSAVPAGYTVSSSVAGVVAMDVNHPDTTVTFTSLAAGDHTFTVTTTYTSGTPSTVAVAAAAALTTP